MNLFIRKCLLFSSLYFIILFLSVGYCFYYNSKKHNYKYDIGEQAVSGYVEEYDFDGNKLSILINASEKIKGTYYIDSLDEKEYLKKEIKYGIFATVKGVIQIPINNTIPNSFNYKKYLH